MNEKTQKSIVVNSKNLIYFIFHNKGNLFFAFRQLSRKKQKNCSFLIVANKLEAKSYETKRCKIKPFKYEWKAKERKISQLFASKQNKCQTSVIYHCGTSSYSSEIAEAFITV